MFDLTSAAVVAFLLFGLVEAVKNLLWGTNKERVIVAAAFVVSLVTIVLVAASDFAHEQVVLDRPLDSLNFASQLVIALLAMGLAAAAFKGVQAVRNIGENQP